VPQWRDAPGGGRTEAVAASRSGSGLSDGRIVRFEEFVRLQDREVTMGSRLTVFGSLASYQKGGVEVIDGDAKHYVFSNVFEVAGKSKPYEKV
jgi:hypothetical protein